MPLAQCTCRSRTITRSLAVVAPAEAATCRHEWQPPHVVLPKQSLGGVQPAQWVWRAAAEQPLVGTSDRLWQQLARCVCKGEASLAWKLLIANSQATGPPGFSPNLNALPSSFRCPLGVGCFAQLVLPCASRAATPAPCSAAIRQRRGGPCSGTRPWQHRQPAWCLLRCASEQHGQGVGQ